MTTSEFLWPLCTQIYFEIRKVMCTELCCLFLKVLLYLVIFNNETTFSVAYSKILCITIKNISLWS